jgi:hypothetical protein
MEPIPFDELEWLAEAIRNNTASLDDYQRYEQLLLWSGLPREYIYSYLQRGGFNSWQEFVAARQSREDAGQISGAVIGGLVGLGLGVLLYKALQEA